MMRTPMRDTMAIGLATLADASRPRAMVVIAREQFYPTSAPISQILRQARLAATPIYMIHLAWQTETRTDHGVPRGWPEICLSQPFERLVIRQRAYSERDTLRQLILLSDATGGWPVKRDESSAVVCAAEIAALRPVAFSMRLRQLQGAYGFRLPELRHIVRAADGVSVGRLESQQRSPNRPRRTGAALRRSNRLPHVPRKPAGS